METSNSASSSLSIICRDPKIRMTYEHLTDDDVDLYLKCLAPLKERIDQCGIMEESYETETGVNPNPLKVSLRYTEVLFEAPVVSIFIFFTDEHVDAFVEWMEANTTTRQMYLGGVIQEHQWVRMFESIKGNTSLTYLSFQGNQHSMIPLKSQIISMINACHLERVLPSYDDRNDDKWDDVHKATNVPFHERLVPLKSKTKSASKIT